MNIKIMNKTLALIGLAFMSQHLWAAEHSSSNGIGYPWEWNPMYIFIGLVAIVMITVMIYFWYITEVLVRNYREDLMKFKGIEPEPIDEAAKTSLWQRFQEGMWKIVPMEKEQNIDLGHAYDGIRELDNRLPPWWVYLFYITIAWAGIYMYIHHFSDIGTSQIEAYKEEVAEAEIQRLIFLEKQANAVNENNVVALTDAHELETGHELYLSNCASCHGQLGEGGVGPNLTDPYWVHGGGIKNVFKTIKYGVPEKGMIAWRNQMQPATMQKIASYILTLEGTNPPNQKEKQGELYEPEEPEEAPVEQEG
jgi:cytochrome c oxidase cbb3-type subunit 3